MDDNCCLFVLSDVEDVNVLVIIDNQPDEVQIFSGPILLTTLESRIRDRFNLLGGGLIHFDSLRTVDKSKVPGGNYRFVGGKLWLGLPIPTPEITTPALIPPLTTVPPSSPLSNAQVLGQPPASSTASIAPTILSHAPSSSSSSALVTVSAVPVATSAPVPVSTMNAAIAVPPVVPLIVPAASRPTSSSSTSASTAVSVSKDLPTKFHPTVNPVAAVKVKEEGGNNKSPSNVNVDVNALSRNGSVGISETRPLTSANTATIHKSNSVARDKTTVGSTNQTSTSATASWVSNALTPNPPAPLLPRTSQDRPHDSRSDKSVDALFNLVGIGGSLSNASGVDSRADMSQRKMVIGGNPPVLPPASVITRDSSRDSDSTSDRGKDNIRRDWSASSTHSSESVHGAYYRRDDKRDDRSGFSSSTGRQPDSSGFQGSNRTWEGSSGYNNRNSNSNHRRF